MTSRQSMKRTHLDMGRVIKARSLGAAGATLAFGQFAKRCEAFEDDGRALDRNKSEEDLKDLFLLEAREQARHGVPPREDLVGTRSNALPYRPQLENHDPLNEASFL